MEGIQLSGEEWTRQELTRLLHEYSPKTRIFSMSKRWNNMSMWAKYADNHQGYCLEILEHEACLLPHGRWSTETLSSLT